MERRRLGALLLRRPANFAWYTNGADNRVDYADPLGVAAILLTPDSEYILTDNVEAGRMREEQTPDLEVVEHPWYGDPLSAVNQLIAGVTLGVDNPLDDTFDVSEDVARLRYVLDPDALDRYRQVGADATASVEEAAASMEPRMDEHEAVANLVAACRRRGLFTPVALAAGNRRIARYRHPIPYNEKLENRVMLVVCAEHGGLYANLTRIIYFEEPDGELRRRQEVCEAMLKKLREASIPGRDLCDVFKDCQDFYAEAGFPGEWKSHHQGGLTGYSSREVLATLETRLKIETGMAFAWNPSVPGAKAEETFILYESKVDVIAAAHS